MTTPPKSRALAALAVACAAPQQPLSPLALDGLIGLLEQLDGPVRDQVLSALAGKSPRLTYAGKGQEHAVDPAKLVPVRTLEDGAALQRSALLFGDNLAVMADLASRKAAGELINADGSHGVRLIYMDPPFATGRDFLFSDGQHAYSDKVTGAEFAEFLRLRLVAARDLLTADGSLYLHLDPHAVHIGKLLADEVFGSGCFRGEIIWKRSTAKGSASRTYGAMHDTILFYTRSSSGWLWNRQFTAYRAEHLEKFYRFDDGDGRGLYGLDNLQKPEAGRGYMYEYDGYAPPPKGWYVTLATMVRLDGEGRIHRPADKSRRLRLKRYLADAKGVPLQDIWDDIPPVQRPRYPTQKPDVLLERIVQASSIAGDWVLDPFSGAGTTVDAAVRLGRRALGIDLGKDAIRTGAGHLPGVDVYADTQLAGDLGDL